MKIVKCNYCSSWFNISVDTQCPACGARNFIDDNCYGYIYEYNKDRRNEDDGYYCVRGFVLKKAKSPEPRYICA